MPKTHFLEHWILAVRKILSKTVPLLFLLVTGVAGAPFPHAASAASCEALVGKWMWFVGGEVTVNPDGTFTQQSGNTGTWECTDATKGAVTLRWRQGGFVNRMLLSPDGQGLSSLDPSQMYVTAKRIGGNTQAKQILQESKQSPQASPSNDAQEIARLVQRISDNYKDTFSTEVFDSLGPKRLSLYRGLSVTRGKQHTLIMRLLNCGFIKEEDYEDPRDGVKDCDNRRNGLEWTEETSEPIPVSRIQLSSIKFSESNGDLAGSDPAISFGYEGYDPMSEENMGFDKNGKPFIILPPGPMRIECKNRSACEQIAADLKRLVEIARKSTATNKAVTR
jgi:hypothetical protein